MSMKTRMAAGAVALCLALTACTGPNDDGTSAAASGTVNYVLPTSWANVEALKEAVSQFQQDSGITVNVQAVPDENYNSVVGSRLAGGTDLDVFAGDYKLFDVPNVMVDVSDEDFVQRMPESSLASVTWTDGKIYSFPSPTSGATFGVFYNKKVFEAAGAEVPATLGEFTETMGKLKAHNVTPLYLAGQDGWTLLQHRNAVNPLMNLEGDTIAKLNANEMRWDEVPALQAQYRALETWTAEGYLNSDALTGTYEQSQKAVVDGEAGMLINGTWVIGEMAALSETAKDDIGFFPIPSEEGQTMLGVSGADGLHIAKSSTNIEAAKEFLRYLASAEVAQKFMDAAPGISNFTDVTVPDDAPASMKDVAAAVESGQTTLAIDNASVVPAPESDLIADYQILISGKSTGAEFLAAEADGMVAAGKQAGVAGF
ncbi:carbohydrate ABC transporter substrate-binding protein [Tessaracoccus sp. MC1865]|uniref:ABC transporter substrate-binding protein n=1 Tax=Tessaracoccus sp. MC1865 TaxID=2760310 RepID=UPI0016027D5E|nr:ABC transporter substrate-binding protein [Tessaracoccus sp. MC1865]MBB1482385.1 carbohydrate ABC transporter substrate-binding protein [Tessaracoccus sp. MC1865]QTO38151.1 carbohydrate ABC transporter substrate-binding protein [Tessaracoccus sp. MC1865]